jgi:HlyD family secretion protein
MAKKALKLMGIGILVIMVVANAGCKKQLKQTVSTTKLIEVKQVVEAFGYVKARDYEDINLDFPAQIQKVPVKDGQNVKLGQPLIYLNINKTLKL